MRLIPGLVLVSAAVALLTLPEQGRPAPAPKDESAGPITPAQLKESGKNLLQVALAFHNYNDTYGTLPTNLLSKDNKPLLSWRVQILPLIEQGELYHQFKLDEPWDSDSNKKLIAKMPKLYAPVRVKADAGKTFYQAFGG